MKNIYRTLFFTLIAVALLNAEIFRVTEEKTFNKVVDAKNITKVMIVKRDIFGFLANIY